MVGSPRGACERCGTALKGRQRRVCSDRCRMVLSRRREKETQRKRDAETVAVVDGIERLCGLLKARLEGQP